jgi:acetyltransferase-like isoleucine patch superfamily enzyme
MTRRQLRMAPQLTLLRCRRKLHGIEAVNRDLATRTQHVADVLVAFGATIAGPGVVHGPLTIHNADGNYGHLHLGKSVHVGRNVLLDLTAPLRVETEAVVSMGCTLLTHADIGNRPLAAELPRRVASTSIGEGAYLGANVTVLAGCDIGRLAVVAAGAVVTRPVRERAHVGGVPARELSPADAHHGHGDLGSS